MIFEIVFGLGILALWDYGRRRLNSSADRQDKLLAHAAEFRAVTDKFEESHEFMRLLLSNFINSMTAIVTLSEERKSQCAQTLTLLHKAENISLEQIERLGRQNHFVACDGPQVVHLQSRAVTPVTAFLTPGR